MEPAPSDVHDAACSWRAWAREGAGEEAAEREPRRSLRLTDKPNFKLKDIANSDTNVAIKWQQQHPLESPRIRQQEMPIDGYEKLFYWPFVIVVDLGFSFIAFAAAAAAAARATT